MDEVSAISSEWIWKEFDLDAIDADQDRMLFFSIQISS